MSALEENSHEAIRLIATEMNPAWEEPLIVSSDFHHPDAMKRKSSSCWKFIHIWVKEESNFLAEKLPDVEERIESLFLVQLFITLIGISTEDGTEPYAHFWTVRKYHTKMRQFLRRLSYSDELAELIAGLANESAEQFKSNLLARLEAYSETIDRGIHLESCPPEEIESMAS